MLILFLEVDVIRGLTTSALPNLCMHPSGKLFAYAGSGYVRLMHRDSLEYLSKSKDARQNNFRYCAVSPDGLYIATIARCSRQIELGLLAQGAYTSFMDLGYIKCHNLCPEFYANRSFVDHFECRFSRNSALIAVSSTHGQLFVARRKGQSCAS